MKFFIEIETKPLIKARTSLSKHAFRAAVVSELQAIGFEITFGLDDDDYDGFMVARKTCEYAPDRALPLPDIKQLLSGIQVTTPNRLVRQVSIVVNSDVVDSDKRDNGKGEWFHWDYLSHRCFSPPEKNPWSSLRVFLVEDGGVPQSYRNGIAFLQEHMEKFLLLASIYNSVHEIKVVRKNKPRVIGHQLAQLSSLITRQFEETSSQ